MSNEILTLILKENNSWERPVRVTPELIQWDGMQTLLLKASLAGHRMSFVRSPYMANKAKASKALFRFS